MSDLGRFQSLIEEHLYRVMVYNRSIDERNWFTLKELFFGGLPLLLRHTVPLIAQSTVRRQLYNQGMGRHRHYLGGSQKLAHLLDVGAPLSCMNG